MARVAHRVYSHVEGPLLAALELADLKNDLKPHESNPLNVHYRELQLAIFRYRPDENPPGERQRPSEPGTPGAGLTQVFQACKQRWYNTTTTAKLCSSAGCKPGSSNSPFSSTLPAQCSCQPDCI